MSGAGASWYLLAPHRPNEDVTEMISLLHCMSPIASHRGLRDGMKFP